VKSPATNTREAGLGIISILCPVRTGLMYEVVYLVASIVLSAVWAIVDQFRSSAIIQTVPSRLGEGSGDYLVASRSSPQLLIRDGRPLLQPIRQDASSFIERRRLQGDERH
jgi:hypothetical protein